MKKILIIFSLISFVNLPVLLAQENDMLRDVMMSRKAERDRILESAYRQTESGNYLKADTIYREILTHIKQIPSNFCFYFGKNSYHIDEHYQSLDWLNKYIELKGTTGAHFDEAKQLIRLNKEIIKAKRIQNLQNTENIFSADFYIDCGPSGKVVCPVCEGETVIIKKAPLGDQYITCTYCDKDGNMTCEDYNKLLKGELPPN